MKTSELLGPALDWAVAKCEVGAEFIGEIDDPHFYSTDWSQGGPIIEREGITLTHQESRWGAQTDDDVFAYGPAPLIAAMRAYVASKLGDEVEIPEELK